jgi:hypothetical protein
MKDSAPAVDEIEISLFGPGFGESVVIHSGDNDWIIIDSCVDNQYGYCAPIKYLQELGVNIDSDVKHIIASHWHDDHARKLSDIVNLCPNARFWCSKALTKREFIKYAELHVNAHSESPSKGSSEISKVLWSLQQQDRRPSFTGPNTLIYENNYCDVFALSPSDSLYEEFLRSIIQQIPHLKSPQRRARNLHPNYLATAILIRLPYHSILLGSDVEEENIYGWSLILEENHCLKSSISVFKVPHHGSSDAHFTPVWNEYCQHNVNAILSPCIKGSNSLPTLNDVRRINSFTNNSYITSSPKSRKSKRYKPPVRKELSENNIKIRRSQPLTGHLRLRFSCLHDSHWSIDKFGPATLLETIYDH